MAAAQILDPDGESEAARPAGTAWAMSHRLAGSDRTEGEKVMAEAMRAARTGVRGLGVTAFPAVAHAALARSYGAGRNPGRLEKQLRLIWAVVRGGV